MSDDIIQKLLESLTPDQKANLIDSLLSSNVKSDEPEIKEESVSSKPQTKVNEDFTVTRDNELSRGKTPVRARRNQWVDDGEDRDPDFDPVKFEKMGRTARNRGKTKKKNVECHVCGKKFSMNENLVYGEYMRCNRCTGR